MSYTNSDLDTIITTLETALGSGAAVVVFEGRRIEYKSNRDIQSAIAYFRNLLAAVTSNTGQRNRQLRISTSTGI